MFTSRSKRGNGAFTYEVSVPGKIFFYSDVYEDEIMYLYTADEYEGEIVTCNEGDLEWVDKSKIMSLNLWEGDKAFLQKLLKNDLSKFVMKLSC